VLCCDEKSQCQALERTQLESCTPTSAASQRGARQETAQSP
jgi:hypothetical protein